MLRLMHEMKAKKAAQKMLAQIVKHSVPSRGPVNVGFRGGNVDREVFSHGEGELWASISRTMPRFRNSGMRSAFSPNGPCSTSPWR